jgi:HTH-type transcriptional regulator / antitoxin HigA
MLATTQIETGWDPMSAYLYVPHTADEYDRLVGLLDHPTDEVGEDERHRLASLLEIVGTLVERYEAERVEELS